MENVNKSYTSIKNWLEDDRPREKLMQNGASALSNSELLAILINTGSGKKSALDLAKEVLKMGNDNLMNLGKLEWKDLLSVKGIGQAKAVTIAAALELGRRRQATGGLKPIRFSSSGAIAEYFKASFQDLTHEVLAVLYLNTSNKFLKSEVLSIGGISGTVADPRIIFRNALLAKAAKVVVCHNHPSGSLKPSQADNALTEKLKKAGELMDICLLDHIIVSEEGYYSYADMGLI